MPLCSPRFAASRRACSCDGRILLIKASKRKRALVAGESRSADAGHAVAAVTIVAHDVGTPGGMERQLGELVLRLVERGHRVTVVARRCGLASHHNLRWIRVPGPARPFSIAYPWFFLIGSLAVSRHRDGLLHTTGAVVLNRADVSTVHFCHRAFHSKTTLRRAERRGILYRANAWAGMRMRLMAERYCYRPGRARHLVAVSTGAAEELRSLFPAMAGSVSVIPNGVDHSAFFPDRATRASLRSQLQLRDDDLVALFVGGEWERKGLRFAVEAVGRTPGWHLVVVGGGDVTRYGQLAVEAGAGERTHFIGKVARTEPYYAAADAFLLPSAYETFSLVTYEAAASGIPLLVTPVSGVEDVLAHGRNGWFIDRDPDVIAKRLHELRADERLRREMGEAARGASNRYAWAPVAGAYARLYGELDTGRCGNDR